MPFAPDNLSDNCSSFCVPASAPHSRCLLTFQTRKSICTNKRMSRHVSSWFVCRAEPSMVLVSIVAQMRKRYLKSLTEQSGPSDEGKCMGQPSSSRSHSDQAHSHHSELLLLLSCHRVISLPMMHIYEHAPMYLSLPSFFS